MRTFCSLVTFFAIGFGNIAIAAAPFQGETVSARDTRVAPIAVADDRPIEKRRLVVSKASLAKPVVVGKISSVIKGKVSKRVLAFRWALKQKGKPYIWGGVGPSGFDCSGLIVKAYKAVGISLPRTTYTLVGSSKLKRINPRDARVGDLIFPSSGHVEMYTGKRGQMYGAHRSGTLIGFKSIYNTWRAYRIVGAG